MTHSQQMDSPKLVQGVYAAVLTPRCPDGSVDVSGLRSVMTFLLQQGIRSFALNGATGEFCLTTPEQLQTMLQVVREAAGDDAALLCGVGAAGAAQSIVLCRIAQQQGVRGLLLPMPYFFPYQPEDLEAFAREVAQATEVPTLLYNLPQFTSGMTKQMVGRLIREAPQIIGIKDSSGSLEILEYLTAEEIPACRIVGNDKALAPALAAGVCDGVVSGVACVLPELIQSVYRHGAQPDSPEFAAVVQRLNEFLAQLAAFPTPWGLKWIAEARGVVQAGFAQPLSHQRQEQGQRVMQWFRSWHSGAVLPTAS